MANQQQDFNSDFIKEIRMADRLFGDIDTKKNNVIELDELKAYIAKKNPEQADADAVFKEFNEMDYNNDGVISFTEYLRALCKKSGVYIVPELSTIDKVQIYQIIEFKHMTDKEKTEIKDAISILMKEMDGGEAN